MTKSRKNSHPVPAIFIVAAVAALTPAACVAQAPPPQTVVQAQGTQVTSQTSNTTVVAVDGQEINLNAGLESAYVLQGSPGEAYLVIDLAAAAAQQQIQRPSMAVALVIDRSGSMSGDKIVNARTAASSFIQNMADGDVVSLYQYDDVIEQIAPPTPVNANSRGALIGLVQGLTPRGSTNLYGGLMAGIESLTSAAAERPVRRVILISDGLANVGPSSPQELGNAAASGAARGVSVTTIGVGLDYDENIMTTVAMRSGGRFYHLQEPAQLAVILENELNALSSTVARGVMIELVPAPGVQILGSSGADLTRQGNVARLSVGDMLGNQSRQVVVPLRVPTAGRGAQPVGALTLQYQAAASQAERRHEAQVSYELAPNQSQVDEALRPQFARAVETYRTAEAQRQAAEAVSQGNTAQAATILQHRSQAMRARATAIGGEQGEYMFDDADAIDGQMQSVQGASSPPARRAMELDLVDSAAEAEGY